MPVPRLMLLLSALALGHTLCACGSLRFKDATDGSASVLPTSGGAALRGGGTFISGGGGPPPSQHNPPSLSELQAFLDAELVRLGKAGSTGHQTGNPIGAPHAASANGGLQPPPMRSGDESASWERRLPGGIRSSSTAPSGSDNAVFDLSAVPTNGTGDPLTPEDISGGAVVSGIRLSWTEQLIGDYDQNGGVNVGDLTPLAQHWEKTVAYDSPALHVGFARWPSGDPADPPVAASYSSPPLADQADKVSALQGKDADKMSALRREEAGWEPALREKRRTSCPRSR